MTETGLFETLEFRSLESENHKTQAPKFKQAPNYNIQWQKRGFVWNIGISVIEIRKSQKSSHAYVVLRRTGTKVQTNNKFQASNLKQAPNYNHAWGGQVFNDQNWFVWDFGISIIGICLLFGIWKLEFFQSWLIKNCGKYFQQFTRFLGQIFLNGL